MPPQSDTVSEVARLRERIAQEHEAACWALSGLAQGNAQHWFISRRMERIGAHWSASAAAKRSDWRAGQSGTGDGGYGK